MTADEPLPGDNYDAFLARLDAATTSLSTRAASVAKARAAVSLLLAPYDSAVRMWEQRRLKVSGQLARHRGPEQSRTALGELHEVAVNMEAVFRDRLRRISETLQSMEERREAIDKSLLELELSRIKLNSSRLLSQDRERLGAVLSELAGPAVAPAAFPDRGLLDDLREARKAVILAEALMEAKGF